MALGTWTGSGTVLNKATVQRRKEPITLWVIFFPVFSHAMDKDGKKFFYPLALRHSFLAAWAVACLHLAGTAWADTQQHAAAHHQNSTGTATPFSAEQVAYGAQIYAGTCAICHGINLEGGHDVPDLGDYFTARWANTPLDQLAGYIARAMPLMAPGTLSPRDTVALVAFLLHQNGVSPSSNSASTNPSGVTSITHCSVTMWSTQC